MSKRVKGSEAQQVQQYHQKIIFATFLGDVVFLFTQCISLALLRARCALRPLASPAYAPVSHAARARRGRLLSLAVSAAGRSSLSKWWAPRALLMPFGSRLGVGRLAFSPSPNRVFIVTPLRALGRAPPSLVARLRRPNNKTPKANLSE